MPSKILKSPVLPDKYYHIFNKANNEELIFKDHADYQFFLKNIDELILKNIDLFAYCLMPNHFHLLIKPKPEASCKGENSINESLRKFFQLYSQYFNKKYKRRGSLFFKSFRRIEIDNDFYLKYLIFYIHFNPQKNNFIKNYRVYEYSSYKFFHNEKPTKLQREIVLEWFDNSTKVFEEFHQDCFDWKVGIGTPSPGTPSPGLESLILLSLLKYQPS
jgi:putative transposase